MASGREPHTANESTVGFEFPLTSAFFVVLAIQMLLDPNRREHQHKHIHCC